MKFASEVMYESEKLRSLKKVFERVRMFYLSAVPLFVMTFAVVGFFLRFILPFAFGRGNVRLLLIEKVYLVLGWYVLFVLLSYPMGYIIHSRRKFFVMFLVNFFAMISFVLTLKIFDLQRNVFLLALTNSLFGFYLFIYYALFPMAWRVIAGRLRTQSGI